MDERLPVYEKWPGRVINSLNNVGVYVANIAPRPAACEEIRYVQCTEFGIEGLTDRISVIQLGRSH
jgi:hypothetical protein